MARFTPFPRPETCPIQTVQDLLDYPIEKVEQRIDRTITHDIIFPDRPMIAYFDFNPFQAWGAINNEGKCWRGTGKPWVWNIHIWGAADAFCRLIRGEVALQDMLNTMVWITGFTPYLFIANRVITFRDESVLFATTKEA